MSEPATTRLLARASELDAAFRTDGGVMDLRAAALEAGISATAFDAAVAELHAEEVGRSFAPSAKPTRRPVKWLVAALVVMFTFASYIVPRSQDVAEAAAPMLEESVLIRCLAPQEVAELLRPILGLRENRVSFSPADPRGVMLVRATEEQLERVRSVLKQNDGTGASACSSKPPADVR